MAPSRSSLTKNEEKLSSNREQEKRQYQAQVSNALNESDDPLAAYTQFVEWTMKNYSEDDPESGLLQLLGEATRQFKEDPMYKADLRYLKLWSLYAKQVEPLGALEIYKYLLDKEIGTTYSTLYEEYASLLEQEGRPQEADNIYRKGIKKHARPAERLRNRYKEFQARVPSSSSVGTQSASSALPSNGLSKATSSSTDAQRRNSLQKHSFKRNKASSSAAMPNPPSTSFNSTAASRYAVMLAPPDPGKRVEKFRFDLSLLFTEESGEYSIQEARARAIGLLGKKWGPVSNPLLSRKSLMVGGSYEPTVTINTKEALADVFGMYNSPDKTTKLMLPGSKHAPLKKVEPVTPLVPPRMAFTHAQNENAGQNAKTPTSTFRPFVDENAQPRRTPATKFTPFIDSEQLRTPAFTTPRPALSVKEIGAMHLSDSKSNESTVRDEGTFAKVFSPVETDGVPLLPLRDVFTDDHGKPTPKPKHNPTHERAKSQHDVLGSKDDRLIVPAFATIIDENARTPFKVFSRPPEQSENAPSNAFTPKTPSRPFNPLQEKTPAFTPFRDTPATFTPFVQKNDEFPDPNSNYQLLHSKSSHAAVSDDEDEGQQMEDRYFEENEEVEEYETSVVPERLPAEYNEGDSYREPPLGGRFGQFNVMTPITERTFEFTVSTRGNATPGGQFLDDQSSPRSSVFVPPQHEHEALETAERLAAELREETSDEYEGDEEIQEQRVNPLYLSNNFLSRQEDPGIAIIEEKTGTLSLADTLSLNTRFRPPNPCNPFDPPIMSTLLSRIPTDPHFYDLRDQQSAKLDPLQRFTKKSRKTSGSIGSVIDDLSTTFPISLNGNKFIVSDKLGEGGFGCVFKATDMGVREDEDVDDDDDDMEQDDENASLVALKVVRPRNLWEYHVLRRLHSALLPSLRRSIVLPHALYAYKDESFLILEICPQGMLLNIVNNASPAGVSQAGACLDELLVVFFSIELLRLVEGMHNAGFIHGDLKIDNCLLRLEDVPGGAAAWSSIYQPSGEAGWSYKGLKIIDFGRTIDTRLFPAGQQYIADWAIDDRDCFEIRENRPWTYQTDYFGLAGIVYCMLFGKYIQASSVVAVQTEEGHRYKISTPFKRYWQTDLWNRLFDVLLNPGLVNSNGELPVCDALVEIREEMEAWLQHNCNRTSNTLKGLLKKVELSSYVR